MKLFLSWSGPTSLGIAQILQKYLPCLINEVNPWLSSSGIASGARWSAEIAANLEASNVGVICVTPENRAEPWILFEAGAIAKLTADGRAMVLRIGLSAADITGPLAQFQSVTTDRDGIRKLVMDINKSTKEPINEASLEISFEALWPKMEAELAKIANQSPAPAVKPRSAEDMLSELLELSRRQEVTLRKLVPPGLVVSRGSGKSHRSLSALWNSSGDLVRSDDVARFMESFLKLREANASKMEEEEDEPENNEN